MLFRVLGQAVEIWIILSGMFRDENVFNQTNKKALGVGMILHGPL